MEGIRIRVARTEDSVSILRLPKRPWTQRSTLNSTLKPLGMAQWDTSSSVDKADPMDLSHAGEGAELQTAEQHRNICRCYMCRRTRHLRPNCLLRKQRQHRQNHTPAPSRKHRLDKGKRQLSVRFPAPTGKELRYVEPLGGREEQAQNS